MKTLNITHFIGLISYLTIFSTFMSNNIFGQENCRILKNQIRTQGWIDSFPVNFPGCKTIDTTLHIRGWGILRLDSLYPLENVKSIHLIDTKVKNLNGLQNLKCIGGLLIHGNDSLSEISQLQNLKKGSSISISSNTRLQSLVGLSVDSILVALDIINNATLSSFYGINAKFIRKMRVERNNLVEKLSDIQVDSIHKIHIFGNSQTMLGISTLKPEFVHLTASLIDDITELNQIPNLQRLVIEYCPELKECSIPIVCQNIDKFFFISVNNNGTGCNTNEEIKAGCLLNNQDIAKERVVVSPNPVLDEIHFRFEQSSLTPLRIDILNPNGKLIKSIQAEDSNELLTIPLTDLTGGMYFYQIYSKQLFVSQGKFIKM